ncbi:MAG: hypothetical protein WCR42_06240 [bacterium]
MADEYRLILVKPIHLMTGSHQMNIESLPKGIYFVKAVGETVKLVKM